MEKNSHLGCKIKLQINRGCFSQDLCSLFVVKCCVNYAPHLHSFIFPQRSGTPVGARRSSITSDFMAEENRREKELERILDRRIADLKTNTEYIIQKYTWQLARLYRQVEGRVKICHRRRATVQLILQSNLRWLTPPVSGHLVKVPATHITLYC